MLKTILFCSFIHIAILLNAQQFQVGTNLPNWQKGMMDIHHISTGRGNAAFCVLPDGTTLLIDAGELSPLDARTFTQRNATLKPDSSRKPYEWIVHYVNQITGNLISGLDYALITHFHDDHFGAWYPDAPLSSSGTFRLTGITGVAEKLKIKTLIDRGFPTYDFPYSLRNDASQYGGGEIEFGKTMSNYFQFLEVKQREGMQVCSLKAGSRSQIHLNYSPNEFPDFFIQNIKSNQWIWTGNDSSVATPFPVYKKNDRKTWPDENSLSLAIAIHYGPFVYYTGGDNPGMLFPGDPLWRDVETPIAKVVGEVDVATMDHHGNRDAVNELMVKTLRPGVWIGQSWSSDHPGHEVLVRMTSPYLYPEKRDLFATAMLEANRLVIGPLIDRAYKSQQGHIVVRVAPGGGSYFVIVLDDEQLTMPVKSIHGPYQAKKKNKIN